MSILCPQPCSKKTMLYCGATAIGMGLGHLLGHRCAGYSKVLSLLVGGAFAAGCAKLAVKYYSDFYKLKITCQNIQKTADRLNELSKKLYTDQKEQDNQKEVIDKKADKKEVEKAVKEFENFKTSKKSISPKQKKSKQNTTKNNHADKKEVEKAVKEFLSLKIEFKYEKESKEKYKDRVNHMLKNRIVAAKL